MTRPKKSISDSKRKLTTWLLAAIAVLAVAAGAFHVLQNSSASVGGTIAPVKSLWLLVVIVSWFAVPLVWSLDTTLERRARQACAFLLANMCARGLVELWMMYVGDNWRHVYGIGHDVGSALLCIGLAWAVGRHARWLAAYFCYCAVLFLLETGFAVYLRDMAHADGSVFFVPASDEHRAILRVSWGAVVFSATVLVILIRNWMYAATSSSSTHG